MISRGNSRARAAAALSLALCLLLALAAGGATAAKKKKKTASVFQQTRTLNVAVPNVPVSGPSTPIRSSVTVGKAFKGKVVGDLNVTGIQTTGSGAGAANDLTMKLTAPNGRTAGLIGVGSGIGDISIGPLTIDDDTPVSICDSATPTCEPPNQTLLRPFAGTANIYELGTGGTGPLSGFDGLNMKGTWTFTIFDRSDAAATSTVNSWGLKITAKKPVRGSG